VHSLVQGGGRNNRLQSLSQGSRQYAECLFPFTVSWHFMHVRCRRVCLLCNAWWAWKSRLRLCVGAGLDCIRAQQPNKAQQFEFVKLHR
jgi:hypothetical protein